MMPPATAALVVRPAESWVFFLSSMGRFTAFTLGELAVMVRTLLVQGVEPADSGPMGFLTAARAEMPEAPALRVVVAEGERQPPSCSVRTSLQWLAVPEPGAVRETGPVEIFSVGLATEVEVIPLVILARVAPGRMRRTGAARTVELAAVEEQVI